VFGSAFPASPASGPPPEFPFPKEDIHIRIRAARRSPVALYVAGLSPGSRRAMPMASPRRLVMQTRQAPPTGQRRRRGPGW